MTSNDTDALWAEYGASRSPELRNQLVLTYAGIVKFVASRFLVPRHVERADLVGYGVIGLMNAIDRFDLTRGLKFETYAIPRIRGAIIDGLRRADWAPRSARAMARAVGEAQSTLEGSLSRTPTDIEVAAEMGMSERDLQTVLRQIALLDLTDLNDAIEVVPAESAEDPESSAVAAAEAKMLRAAIACLGKQERTVMSLYYYEELDLNDIGKVLGVSKSRVCQIRKRAIVHLRVHLQQGAAPVGH